MTYHIPGIFFTCPAYAYGTALPITREHINQDLIWCVEIGAYIGFLGPSGVPITVAPRDRRIVRPPPLWGGNWAACLSWGSKGVKRETLLIETE